MLREPDLTILPASANTWELFGIPADALLQQGLSRLLGEEQTGVVRLRLGREALTSGPPHVITARVPHAPHSFNGFAHRIDGVVILELERIDASAGSASGFPW